MIITNKNNNNESNIFKHIIFRYLPYWPLFLTLLVVCLSGAYAWIQFATPVYESTAKILVQDEKKGAQESEAIESFDKLSSHKIIENEVEVIKSKPILNEAVNTLGLYAVFYQKKGLKSVSAYTISPVIVVVRDTNKIESSKDIHFSVMKENSVVSIGNKKYPVNAWQNTDYGVLKFIPNPNYIPTKDTGNFYFKLMPVKEAVTSLAANFIVSTPTKEASILNLSLKDEDPVRSKNALNEIMTAYQLSLLKEKNILAANTLKFIDNRLASVGNDLDSIETKVQQYKANENAVDIGTQSQLYLQNLSSNNQKLSDINVQLAALNQVQSYVQSKGSNDNIVPSTVGINDPSLSRLLGNLSTAQTDYDKLVKTTGIGNPIVVSVKEQIDKLKPEIIENIASQKSILLASRQDLSHTNNAYSGQISTMPGKERQLNNIGRQQSIKNSLYDFLLQKKEETSLSLLSNQPDNKIIEQADFSNNPVSPNKKLAYVSSFLIAIILGVGIVMGKESFGQKIMFRHDIERLTKNPVIAEITAGDSGNENVLEYDTKTLIGQQFRNLRTALGYFSLNQARRKRILITSGISGEGKSFITGNLAVTLAITGKKVVVVDFDLANPSLSKKLGLKDSIGLADFLIDNKDPQDIIQETSSHKNLYAIAAGKQSGNAAELITGEHVETLLNYLDNNFDYIVIDSAPVANVSDAYMLSSFCDTTLYVIRHSYTPKILIEQIEEMDKTNGLKNVGIVFNGVRTRGYMNKYYGYGHSYPYLYNNDKKTSSKQITLLKSSNN